MRPYRAIFSAKFRTRLQYRAAALAGSGTQLFWGLIRIMIFTAFYQSTTADQPMTLPEVVSYIWLSQAFLGLLPWMSDEEAASAIQSGNISYELLRPINLYSLWYSRIMASRIAKTSLRAVPLVLVAGLFFGMQPPVSWASGGAWGLALIGALLLSCAVSTLLTITLLWTVVGDGIANFAGIAMWLLTGLVVPLPFFPDWAQRILDFLPFRGLFDIPARLYSGNLPAESALPLFAQQLAWTAALVLFGHWLLARGARRLVVQGG